MNWQSQREEWNRDNQCAREACRGPLFRPGRRSCYGRHTGTNLLYCAGCARLIADVQGDVMAYVEVDKDGTKISDEPTEGKKA